jgi:hypothetical protein
MTVGYLVYDINKNPVEYVIQDFDEAESNVAANEISHWMELPNPPTGLNMCTGVCDIMPKLK